MINNVLFKNKNEIVNFSSFFFPIVLLHMVMFISKKSLFITIVSYCIISNFFKTLNIFTWFVIFVHCFVLKAFDLAEKELGISPVMTGKDMAECEVPDKLTMVSYLSQFYVAFKKEKHPKCE